MQANELQEHWFGVALHRARIDRGRWHPGRGLSENRATVRAVYRYYGQLFLENPHLMWAGMAATIGPAFVAGFQDLGMLPDAAREAVADVLGRSSRRLARSAAGDLGYYETTFLTMQKKIFEDQAPMHEAYLAEGIAEIERFYRAQIIDAATLDAWRQIDAGRAAGRDMIADGNRMLLFREQHDIIDQYYARMLAYRQPLGAVFTYLMTLAGAPSVPRARSYPQQYPLRVQARIPRMVINARTPLADGNIAVFADRWKLIESNTLPAYLALLRDHPAEARKIVSMPLSRRVRAYRLLARAGQLAADAVTQWQVVLSAAPSRSPVPGTQPDRALPRAAAPKIDLARPLTRESAGFAAHTDTRVWMDPRRAPFPITVTLPGGREYHACAEMAVMLSSARTGDPDRLTIRLPPADADDAVWLIGDYAAQWGFSADEVEMWRVSSARRTSGDRRYVTHVFRAADMGPVHLEFQVSHHVRERAFVVASLFSWDSHAAGTRKADGPTSPDLG